MYIPTSKCEVDWVVRLLVSVFELLLSGSYISSFTFLNKKWVTLGSHAVNFGQEEPQHLNSLKVGKVLLDDGKPSLKNHGENHQATERHPWVRSERNGRWFVHETKITRTL